MEWVRSLNKAIDYIEDNLLGELTCEEIGKHVYISSYHFQRAFTLLTGMSIGEYVRNRRLSLAGQELSLSNSKVSDVALKYGYETPESFTRAFSRFHGITPSQAKVEGSTLKSFNRLLIKINLEGGQVMDYKIMMKAAFHAVAKTKYFTAQNSETEIPKFWEKYFTEGSHKKVCADLGICEQAKTDAGEFRYGIGSICQTDANIPDGFERLMIPAYTWAVFTCTGPMPNTIQDMWVRIYSEWLPQAEYELISDYDIEYYTEGDNQNEHYESEIWIPVKKKETH